MEAEQIRKLRLAHPFRPFILVMNDGRRFVIDQPFYVAISPLNNVILVATGGEKMEMFKPEWVQEAVFPEEAGTTSGGAPSSKESA
jgi:hypothetical protein